MVSCTEFLSASIGFESFPPPYIGSFVVNDHAADYYIVMPLALIGLYVSFSILSSDIGRSIKAIREDQLAAAASGIHVSKYKVIAFVISALYAGCAGSLRAHLAPGILTLQHDLGRLQARGRHLQGRYAFLLLIVVLMVKPSGLLGVEAKVKA